MKKNLSRAVTAFALVVALAAGLGCAGDDAPEKEAGDRDAVTVTSLDITSGPRSGYQNVTISGTGFDGVTSVRFGSTEVLGFTTADLTRIVAVAPSGELGQVVDVTVTTAAGTGTLTGAYTYWDYDLKLTNGTNTATYTLDQLRAMPSVTGYWGAHKDPVPHDTDQYRGVPLLTLLEAVGGWTPGEDVTVRSADDFAITYTTEILEQMAGGTYPMWNANGTEIITDDRFARPIVAYEIDAQGDGSSWELPEAGTGPLRMALITAEPDRVSQGKYNPFLVVSVEVHAGSGGSATTAVPAVPPAGNSDAGEVDNDGALTLAALEPSEGPRSGYQNVTISGTGLDRVTGVRFGSTEAASFTVVDGGRIVAKTPAGELGRVVDVTVTTGTGTSTLAAAYTYWDYDLVLTKGGSVVTYTLDEIKAMPSVTGYWGAINDRPYDTARYQGVLLFTLLEAVGGRAPGEEITVRSADGFATTYTSEILEQMADGVYPMWNINGTSVVTDDRFAQLLVAYVIDGEPLRAGKGPFRIVAMTAEDDRLSQGPWNPALAVSIEVAGP